MNRVTLLALVCSAAWAGCAPAPGPVGEPSAPDSLEDARALWERAGTGNYDFTIGRSCFCPPESRGPFDATVRDGRIVALTRAGAPADTALARIPTVDGLFDEIEAAYAADAAEVRVSYDERLGYPTEVWIDLDQMMADEEVGYSVSELVVE